MTPLQPDRVQRSFEARDGTVSIHGNILSFQEPKRRTEFKADSESAARDLYHQIMFGHIHLDDVDWQETVGVPVAKFEHTVTASITVERTLQISSDHAPSVGDRVTIGDTRYKITAVSDWDVDLDNRIVASTPTKEIIDNGH